MKKINGEIIKKCELCGKKLINLNKGRRQTYCSEECRYNAKRIRELSELSCDNCGKNFQGYKGNKFCSSECKGEHRKKNFNKFKCQCLICRKGFESIEKNSKYCSSTCRGKAYYENNRFKGVCIVCENYFESHSKDQKCCSVKCEGKRRRLEACERNNDSFPTGRARIEYKRRQRKIKTMIEKVELNKLIVRDNGICKICGELVDLRVHYNHHLAPTNDHIIPLALGGETSYKNCQLAHRGCNSRKSHFMKVEEVRKWQDQQKAQMS